MLRNSGMTVERAHVEQSDAQANGKIWIGQTNLYKIEHRSAYSNVDWVPIWEKGKCDKKQIERILKQNSE